MNSGEIYKPTTEVYKSAECIINKNIIFMIIIIIILLIFIIYNIYFK
jgi:uncharacterized integral membrane protein